jgi:hypothetical protein
LQGTAPTIFVNTRETQAKNLAARLVAEFTLRFYYSRRHLQSSTCKAIFCVRILLVDFEFDKDEKR